VKRRPIIFAFLALELEARAHWHWLLGTGTGSPRLASRPIKLYGERMRLVGWFE
jgi:hypothetical protein